MTQAICHLLPQHDVCPVPTRRDLRDSVVLAATLCTATAVGPDWMLFVVLPATVACALGIGWLRARREPPSHDPPHSPGTETNTNR